MQQVRKLDRRTSPDRLLFAELRKAAASAASAHAHGRHATKTKKLAYAQWIILRLASRGHI